MRSLSMTVFNAGTSKRCAEAVENENCAVQFAFLVPRNSETVTATKVAIKGCDRRIIWCTCAKREDKTRRVE